MNPSTCPFLPGPYVPPECIPWPQNEHEAHVIIVIWLVSWTVGLLLLFLETRRMDAAEAAHATIEMQAPAQPQNMQSIEARS